MWLGTNLAAVTRIHDVTRHMIMLQCAGDDAWGLGCQWAVLCCVPIGVHFCTAAAALLTNSVFLPLSCAALAYNTALSEAVFCFLVVPCCPRHPPLPAGSVRLLPCIHNA
jgi:hypothetical protein